MSRPAHSSLSVANARAFIAFVSRTQMEAWMSMQHGSAGGMSGVGASASRYSVIPMHNASRELADMLVKMWAVGSAVLQDGGSKLRW